MTSKHSTTTKKAFAPGESAKNSRKRTSKAVVPENPKTKDKETEDKKTEDKKTKVKKVKVKKVKVKVKKVKVKKIKVKSWILKDVSGDRVMKPGDWAEPDSLQVLRDLSDEQKAKYKKNWTSKWQYNSHHIYTC